MVGPVVEDGRGGIVEKQREANASGELLFGLAAGARLFRAADGRFHARVPVNGRHEILGLRSTAFRDWLVDGYRSAYQKLPPQRAVQRVIEALEARARFELHTPQVYIRVAPGRDDDGSSIYLDLGDSSGRAVQIGAGGWSIVEQPGVGFRRPYGLLPLPVPSHDGSIELLRPFVNLGDAEFRLLVVWMGAALRLEGPYSVLAIDGEQGSAKSTLAKIVRQLIDPQTAPLLAEPHSTRDLMVTAVNGWLLAYDNISMLPGWLSDSFCRLASGGGYATRALYSDEERSVLYAQRPIILNGIEEFVRKGDLADRGVFLHLPPFRRGKRREEAEFWGSFRELQPRILGGLLDAVAGALRELPSVRLDDLPRMADFARFGEAMGRALGWPAETFLRAYRENRREATASTLENSVLGTMLLKKAMEYDDFEVTETPTRWLELLTRGIEDRRTLARMPKTATALGNELRRVGPQLREYGITVTFSRTRDSRQVTITKESRSDYSGVTP